MHQITIYSNLIIKLEPLKPKQQSKDTEILQAHTIGLQSPFTETSLSVCLHKILIIYYSNRIMTKERKTSSCFSF